MSKAELQASIEETKGILIGGNLDQETYGIMYGIMMDDVELLKELEEEEKQCLE